MEQVDTRGSTLTPQRGTTAAKHGRWERRGMMTTIHSRRPRLVAPVIGLVLLLSAFGVGHGVVHSAGTPAQAIPVRQLPAPVRLPTPLPKGSPFAETVAATPIAQGG